MNIWVLQDAGYCLIRSGAAACQGFCSVEQVDFLFIYHTPLQFFLNYCIFISTAYFSRSLWPRGLRRGSVATRLLGLRVRIPLMAWISFRFERCLLSVRGLRDGPIPRPEESYQMYLSLSVIKCDSKPIHLE
jgi:hypothetical protein